MRKLPREQLRIRPGRTCPAAICLGFFFLLFPALLNASASTFDFEYGHWTGRVERDGTGRAAACVVSTHNQEEEMLLLRFDRSSYLSLGLFGVNWGPGAPETDKVAIFIDHLIVKTGVAMASRDDAVVVELSQPIQTLTAIQQGQMLAVSVGKQDIVFELDGADKAVPFLWNCRSAAYGRPHTS